jgi:hypothetical protein
MELASMLAGDRFTDKPRSVSPVIGGFLRTYNDCIDDDRRQDLYPYAARIVGTRAPRPVECSRARHCAAWIRNMGGDVPWMMPLRPAWFAGSLAARHAVDHDPSEEIHARALGLIDELISFSDGSAGIPSDPGELVAPAADAQRDAGLRSAMEGACR